MLHIALYQPEIPPNTGNIIRLCANTKAQLHLIHPLGFAIDDKRLQRAGLDYHEWANVKEYKNYDEFAAKNSDKTIYACTTKATKYHTDFKYKDNDVFLLGPETRGLPEAIINQLDAIKIPMAPNSRSLNLSNSAAIILYEAWRQLDFEI